MILNREQLAIQFRVDNLKSSHIDQNVLDSLVDNLNDKFKTKKKMLVDTKGLIHDYLGLTIGYSKKHYVIFTMYDYLEDILKEVHEDMDNEAKSPAKGGLFTIDHSSPLLNKKRANFFYRMTTRLSISWKRSHPDIKVAVAFFLYQSEGTKQI